MIAHAYKTPEINTQLYSPYSMVAAKTTTQKIGYTPSQIGEYDKATCKDEKLMLNRIFFCYANAPNKSKR